MSFGSLPSVLGNGGGVAISVIGGTGLFADGTAAAPSISFASQTNKGFYNNASNQIGVAIAGVYSMAFAASGQLVGVHGGNTLQLDGNGACKLTASGTNQNITLTPSGTGANLLSNNTLCGGTYNAGGSWRQGTLVAGNDGYDKVIAGHLISSTNGAVIGAHGSAVSSWVTLNVVGQQILFRTNGEVEAARIGTNQRFLIGTQTDSGALLQVGANAATGYALAGMSFGGDTFLSRENAGTLRLSGANPVMALMPTTATQAGFFTVVNSGGTTYIGCDNSTGGNFGAGAYTAIFGSGSAATAIVSLGVKAVVFDTAQGATFAAGITTGGSIVCAAGGTVQWNGRSAMGAPSDGVIRLTNNAGSDFTRLQFGGTTASFPALRRSAAILELVTADASAYTQFRSGCQIVSGAATTVAANEVGYGGTTATTVGAAGGASLLPATPLGYIIINVAGTTAKIPYYNS